MSFVLRPLSMAQLQGVVSELAASPKAATRPALADVSDTSGDLWELVVQEAAYHRSAKEGDKDRLRDQVKLRLAEEIPRLELVLWLCTLIQRLSLIRSVHSVRSNPGPSGESQEFRLVILTRFVQSAVEGNVWKITTESGEVVGFAIIYVDDIMLLSTQSEAEKAYSWIREQWKCTPLQQAEEGQPVTFLGVDVYMGRDDQGNIGFMLCQSGYIQELLRCYSVVPKTRAAPVPKEWFKDMPEAESYTQEELRNAQKITGELLWVTQRSGVDLAYAVALMGSWTVRAPRVVKKIGMRLLEYLGATCDYRLSLIPTADAYEGVTAFSDASFAPYGCNSITGALVTFRLEVKRLQAFGYSVEAELPSL
ncbi:hypothetical protein AK812_SmicGene44993 [Symbiodinium microadriaticum]|uniref:Reverse transcriptase Ty1/copia-type domain-containing protein n=1 Tax=Symbiodinium microadriaticum TaxID=2951 RepID=A0A1Q9BX85_SYMMI|nr:hypothetical protein AK812_SmicGene44993 [Symbiodinium microadriaticum]